MLSELIITVAAPDDDNVGADDVEGIGIDAADISVSAFTDRFPINCAAESARSSRLEQLSTATHHDGLLLWLLHLCNK